MAEEGGGTLGPGLGSLPKTVDPAAAIVVFSSRVEKPERYAMSKIASYFTKADRKKLFFDYLKLIAILEMVIFIVVALWSTDDKAIRTPSAFPWKEYLFVAFAFPIMLTFLMGVIIAGFNHFLGEEVTPSREEADDEGLPLVGRLKRLPLLAILFLLLVTILGLYNMHHIMGWLRELTESTFLLLTYIVAGIGVVAVIYLLFFLFFKYRLNQRQMRYNYYSQISERHGLIILDDRTVLHKSGNLLVQGRRWGRPKQVGSVPVTESEATVTTVTVTPEEPEMLPPSEGDAMGRLPVPKS